MNVSTSGFKHCYPKTAKRNAPYIQAMVLNISSGHIKTIDQLKKFCQDHPGSTPASLVEGGPFHLCSPLSFAVKLGNTVLVDHIVTDYGKELLDDHGAIFQSNSPEMLKKLIGLGASVNALEKGETFLFKLLTPLTYTIKIAEPEEYIKVLILNGAISYPVHEYRAKKIAKFVTEIFHDTGCRLLMMINRNSAPSLFPELVSRIVRIRIGFEK